MNKLLTALGKVRQKKDTIPVERLEIEMVRETIFMKCEEYLTDATKILQIEILPNALDSALACLHTEKFLEKYEFQQQSETIFLIKMKEYNLI